MLPSDLTDREWQIIEPYLPPPKRLGRRRTDLRRIINGIRYQLKTGCRWEDIPPERYAPGKTCWHHFNAFKQSGRWSDIAAALRKELAARGKLNLTNGYLDASIRQNKRGIQNTSDTPVLSGNAALNAVSPSTVKAFHCRSVSPRPMLTISRQPSPRWMPSLWENEGADPGVSELTKAMTASHFGGLCELAGLSQRLRIGISRSVINQNAAGMTAGSNATLASVGR